MLYINKYPSYLELIVQRLQMGHLTLLAGQFPFGTYVTRLQLSRTMPLIQQLLVHLIHRNGRLANELMLVVQLSPQHNAFVASGRRLRLPLFGALLLQHVNAQFELKVLVAQRLQLVVVLANGSDKCGLRPRR